MPARLYPNLARTDESYWERCFPDGVGPSIFSSPGWQRLMLGELGTPWESRFLRGRTSDGEPVTVPVLAKTNTWGRRELLTRPVAYFVAPIEDRAGLREASVHAVLDAARAAMVSTFTWWLPPWCTCADRQTSGTCDRCVGVGGPVKLRRFGPTTQWCGELVQGTAESYVIDLSDTPEEHLARHVPKRQQQQLRASHRAGVEVVPRPGPEEVREYASLYERVARERHWVGDLFTPGFFRGVAGGLGRGGELMVLRLGARVIGGAVIGYDRHAVHMFQSTTDRSVTNVHGGCVVYQYLIEQAHARGLRYINLGGVNDGNEGLIRFKREWGGRPLTSTWVRWMSTRQHLLSTLRNAWRWRQHDQATSPSASSSAPAPAQPDPAMSTTVGPTQSR